VKTTCQYPTSMYVLGTASNGKKIISQNLPPSGSKFSEILRDCGQCSGCRIRRRMDWATRLTHEAQFNEHAFFITLTYADDHLPADGSLNPDHVSEFMQNYRNQFRAKKVRFFAIGEYGGDTGRPHYHVIIFGPDIDQKSLKYVDYPQAQFSPEFRKLFGETGLKHYTSPLLEKCWPYGLSEFGYTSAATMQYVTKFHVEKVTGDKAETHYNGRHPEFSRMSRMPGIGTDWIEKYWPEVYRAGCVQNSKGVKAAPPKFYDRWLEKNHPEVYTEVKQKRESNIGYDKLLTQRRDAIAVNRNSMLALNVNLGEGRFKNSPGVTASDLARQYNETRHR